MPFDHQTSILIAALPLQGPSTPGELRYWASRIHRFPTSESVIQVLKACSCVRLKGKRWIQTLTAEPPIEYQQEIIDLKERLSRLEAALVRASRYKGTLVGFKDGRAWGTDEYGRRHARDDDPEVKKLRDREWRTFQKAKQSWDSSFGELSDKELRRAWDGFDRDDTWLFSVVASVAAAALWLHR